MNTITKNAAGGKAIRKSKENSLATMVCTGTQNGVFYADADKITTVMKALAHQVSPEDLGKILVYGRKKGHMKGHMKDLPALGLAILATKDSKLFRKVAPHILDNSKMLRNFVKYMRDGSVGRKSLGHAAKKAVQRWFDEKDAKGLFYNSIGNDPSLADVIRLAHPKPKTKEAENMFAYILGREYKNDLLPDNVQEYESYKQADRPGGREVPNVPFQMLDSLGLDKAGWIQIAERASWQQTRMLLNTFVRHGVFESHAGMEKIISDRLRNRDLIAKSRVFPYQLLVAFKNAEGVPQSVLLALQDALDIACENVPKIDGKVFIFPDVSGSMRSPVTGYRYGGQRSSTVRCVDVAALFAAALLKKNPEAIVRPFDTKVHRPKLNPRDSVMTLADKLARYGGGGTNCSLAMQELNREVAKDTSAVVYISDSESWADVQGRSRNRYWGEPAGTNLMEEWNKFKGRNQEAKLVCMDMQPYTTSQADENRRDILLVGGFSDRVFDVVADYVKYGERNWIDIIRQEIDL